MSKWSSVITTSKEWFLKRFGNDTVDHHDKNININNNKTQPPERVSSHNKNNVNSSNAVVDRRFSQSRRHDSPAQPKPYDELMERAAYLTRKAQERQHQQQMKKNVSVMDTKEYVNALENLMKYVPVDRNPVGSSQQHRRFLAARKADELLLAIEKQILIPNKESYYLRILVAYERSNIRSIETATLANNMLDRIIDLSADPRLSSTVKLKMPFFDITMRIFRNSISSRNIDESNIHAALKVEEILQKALQFHEQGRMDTAPTSPSFDCAITAWSRCSSKIGKNMGANRSYELLKNMIRLYRQGILISTEVTIQPFRLCLEYLSQIESPCGNTSGNQYETPGRAEEVMEWLISLYKETGAPTLKPDLLCWTYLLSSWVQATSLPGSMDNCFSVYERMKEYCETPNIKILSLMFKAAIDRGLGDISLELFEKLKENYKLFPCRRVPEKKAVKLMYKLSEESRSDSFDRVEAFFNHCTKSPDVIANSEYIYKIMISILIDSNVVNKAERALSLLIEARERHLDRFLNTRRGSAVLNFVFIACAKTNGSVEEKEAALRIALECFHECESRFGVKLENVYLPRVIEAITLHAPENERLKLLESVFSEYKARQLVSAYVVDVMKEAGAAHLVSQLEKD